MFQVVTLKEVRQTPASLLDTINRRGANHYKQCGQGICGACKCKLKKGKVKYVREPIGFHDEDEILPCIAIPASEEVVLES